MWKAICLCCAVASTLAAAELEGYDSVGVELSEEIAKSAAQRLSVPLKKVGD